MLIFDIHAIHAKSTIRFIIRIKFKSYLKKYNSKERVQYAYSLNVNELSL